jgi:cystathionine beta-lyase family protein involved in aluminum resistance
MTQVAYLSEKVHIKEAQLQAEKKRAQRLQGKVSSLLTKLEDQEMLCENSSKLLDAYNGMHCSDKDFIQNTVGYGLLIICDILLS